MCLKTTGPWKTKKTNFELKVVNQYLEIAVNWMIASLKVHFRYYTFESRDAISDYAKHNFSKENLATALLN